MATLNAATCATNLRNTGTGTCTIDPGLIGGAIKIPDTLIMTQANLDVLETFIRTGLFATLKDDRFFPINDFHTPTDSSEATVWQTFGNGSKKTVRNGRNNWMFQYSEGALCRSNSLQSFNFLGTTTWLFWDVNNLLIGRRVKDSTGAWGLAGVPLTFHADPWKMATGAEVTKYTVTFDFDPKYINSQLGFVKADFELSDLQGLQNIVIEPQTTLAAGAVKVRLYSGCNKTNLYDKYKAEILAGSIFVLTNTTTGNAIPVTGVADDPNIKGFTISPTVADADYPAIGASLTLDLISPTALKTALITPYEGIPVSIVRAS